MKGLKSQRKKTGKQETLKEKKETHSRERINRISLAV